MSTQTDTNPQPQQANGRSSLWRRGAVGVALITGGFVLGAATLASAGGGMGPWHGGFHHGPRVGMIQHFVRNALDNVGASTAQEDKVHDIIAATYTELQKDKLDRDAMRKQVLDIMRAPTIDRAAAEKMRAEKVAAFDAKTKKIVGAVLDAAAQLTPEQRAKLVEQAEKRMARGGWGGWRHWKHDGPQDNRGNDHGDDRPDRGGPHEDDHG